MGLKDDFQAMSLNCSKFTVPPCFCSRSSRIGLSASSLKIGLPDRSKAAWTLALSNAPSPFTSMALKALSISRSISAGGLGLSSDGPGLPSDGSGLSSASVGPMDIDSEKPLDIRREPLTLAAVGTVPGTETLVGIMSSFEPLRAIPVAEFGCGVSGRVSGIGGRARMLALADALWNRSNEVRQQLFYARRAGLLCRLRSLGELPCRSYCADLT